MVEDPIQKSIKGTEKFMENYMKQFKELSDAWHEIYLYIKPLIENQKKEKELCAKIHSLILTLPIANMTINTANMITIDMMRTQMKALMPELKIECPDCKKVVWDVEELKHFLDPEGKIYGK